MPAKRRRTPKVKLSVDRASLRDLDALVHQRRAMWKALGIRSDELHEKGDRVYKRWARARLKNHELMAWVVRARRVGLRAEAVCGSNLFSRGLTEHRWSSRISCQCILSRTFAV